MSFKDLKKKLISLPGTVVKSGQKHGIAAPVNQALLDDIHALAKISRMDKI
jgi:ketopantoate reductase